MLVILLYCMYFVFIWQKPSSANHSLIKANRSLIDCLLRKISQDKSFAFYLVIKNSKNKNKAKVLLKIVSNKFQIKIVYRKYRNLVRTQVEINSDHNYLVCILFER